MLDGQIDAIPERLAGSPEFMSYSESISIRQRLSSLLPTLPHRLLHALSAVVSRHSTVVLAVVWFASLGFYLRSTLHTDVSWYLVTTDRFLDGARLYRDIIEVNPPLGFYLTVPPVWIARHIGLAPESCFIGYLFGLIACSLLLSRSILRQTTGLSLIYQNGMLHASLLALVVLPMPVLGEREHLLSIFALPYLFVAGLRSENHSPSPLLAFLVGIWAALGFGLKPYFLLTPVLIELYLMALKRSPMPRAETLGLAVGLMSYGALAWIFHPEYFDFIVPLARLVYLPASYPFLVILAKQQNAVLAFPAIAYVVSRFAGARRFGMPFALATVGFFAAYLVQAKGFYYHLIPPLITAWLAMADILFSTLEHGFVTAHRHKVLRIWSIAGLTALAVGPIFKGTYQDPFNDVALPIVRKYASGGTIYAFTPNMGIGFPLVGEAKVGWPSRFPSLWLLSEAIKQQSDTEHPNDEKQRALREIERYATNAVIEDLERNPPTLIFVEEATPDPGQVTFDYLEYFGRDPRFARFWRAYARIGSVRVSEPEYRNDLSVWCRRDQSHSCSDVPSR